MPPRNEPAWQTVGHRPERVRRREYKRLESQARHFGHDLLQKDCEHIVPRGYSATLSQKYEMRLALGDIGQRRLAGACPHDKFWFTGLSACNLRFFPWYLALEHAWEILREKTITPLCNPILPKTRFPWITHASLSCEVDPVAHIPLDTAPHTGYAQTATPSVFTDSVPDDYATEVLLAAVSSASSFCRVTGAAVSSASSFHKERRTTITLYTFLRRQKYYFVLLDLNMLGMTLRRSRMPMLPDHARPEYHVGRYRFTCHITCDRGEFSTSPFENAQKV